MAMSAVLGSNMQYLREVVCPEFSGKMIRMSGCILCMLQKVCDIFSEALKVQRV